ncbi:MAG TPA: serine hydrolase domain-containing protein [Steroidobacteraceae bacterium]|nr:serine hydrolase domain-containing protein [Steroidobacteraceae bacterium]
MSTAATGFSAARLQRLSERLRADVERGEIPGAVALIIHDGRVAYFEAFGYSSRAAQRPMAPDCIFRIASMTKPITVAAALQLMERGELALADPVAHFLPSFASLGVGRETVDAGSDERSLAIDGLRRAMTVHDLMRHTAGFTYGPFGDSLVQRAYRNAKLLDDQQTNAELVEKLARLPLAYQPGTTFEYGMSTDVLGRIVEVVSGLSLDRFIAERITGPLGMADTGFAVKAAALDRLAEPQAEAAPSPAAPAVAPHNPAKPARWFSGGGGLLSTAADYARFCRMLLNRGELEGVHILSRTTVACMTSNQLPADLAYGPLTQELASAAPLPQLGQGYGLGLGVRVQQGLANVPGSVGDYFWGGATGPYFWVDPQERLIVILMLQEQNAARRARYRALLRNLVYQALD